MNQINPLEQFNNEVSENIRNMGLNKDLFPLSRVWIRETYKYKYTYNFSCLGRPIIQIPQDIVAMQELIWQVKPDLIIETGIAHGGSLIMSASMLALLDMCEAIESGLVWNPNHSNRKILGIDVDIRQHNREAIEAHPMISRIQMIQGSSISANVIEQVEKIAKNYQRILVCLDSNHTHEHVLAELNAYAHLTSVGSYCVVFDTLIEDMPKEMFHDRSWGPGNNPKTAVWEYLKTHSEFQVYTTIQNKLLITVAPDGYLKRTK